MTLARPSDFEADSDERIHEHARLSGFPANRIESAKAVIDPSLAPA